MPDLNKVWIRYSISANNYKDSYNGWYIGRHENINTIKDISESLKKYENKNVTVKTGSYLAYVTGGAMTFLGLAFLPFTAGLSGALVVGGAAMTAGSAAVHVSCKVLEIFVSKKKCKHAEGVVKQDKKFTNELKEAETEYARRSKELAQALRNLRLKDPQRWREIERLAKSDGHGLGKIAENLQLATNLEESLESVIGTFEIIDAPMVDQEMEKTVVKKGWLLPALEYLNADHAVVIGFLRLLVSFLTGLVEILSKSQFEENAKLLKTYCINLTQELNSMEDNEIIKWLLKIEIDPNLFQYEFWDRDRNPESEATLHDTGLDFLEKKVDIVRTVHGGASVIRAVNSDVILHTPQGLHAIILGNIHTNHSNFKNFVPSNECIVGPICEYHVKPLPECPKPPVDAKFKLKIPHIIKNVEKFKHLIRVRHGDIHGNEPLRLKGYKDRSDILFDVDEKYVTIHTTHFSGFIVSVEDLNCCASSANILLFGSLKNVQGERPLVTLKVYFSGSHSSKIRDYELALRNKEALFNRKILTTKEVLLSTDPYDSGKSFVHMFTEPDNSEVWRPHRSSGLFHEFMLNVALKFNDGHICKRNPTDVTEFYLESTEPTATNYRGILQVILDIAVLGEPTQSADSTNQARDNGGNITTRQSRYKILTDIQDKISQSASIRGQTQGALTPRELSKLARRISPENLRVIALEHLDFEVPELQTLAASHGPDIQQYKFDILYNWTNKSDDNNRLSLVAILEECATDGLVDHSVIDEVLRTDQD